MSLDRFVTEREHDWVALARALDRARGRPERLGPDGVLELGRLYRAAAADLALARRRYPHDPVVPRLEALVRRGRVAVYARSGRRTETLAGFLSRGYWRRVRERPRLLALAWALLLVPAALAAIWGSSDPGAAIGIVPGEYQGPTAESGDLGLGAEQEAAFASQIFTNNIRVTFLAFAAGLLVGLGTAAVLVYIGAVIGALGGIVAAQGDGALFVELVSPHGVLELSCIAVTAAAGLRMGAALVDPGPRPRAAALAAEARSGVEVVLGTMPWLVLAGLVEGFVTGSGLGLGLALAIGFALGAVFWALALLRGAPTSDAAGAPARAG
jgi:uncharacterized membrane protein SpoIIM required for sporulation